MKICFLFCMVMYNNNCWQVFCLYRWQWTTPIYLGVIQPLPLKISISRQSTRPFTATVTMTTVHRGTQPHTGTSTVVVMWMWVKVRGTSSVVAITMVMILKVVLARTTACLHVLRRRRNSPILFCVSVCPPNWMQNNCLLIKDCKEYLSNLLKHTWFEIQMHIHTVISVRVQEFLQTCQDIVAIQERGSKFFQRAAESLSVK